MPFSYITHAYMSRLVLLSAFLIMWFSIAYVTYAQAAIVTPVMDTGARITSTQNQPMNIELISGAYLERYGVGRLSDLANLSRNLVVRDDGPSQASFGLRGIGLDAGPDNQGASIGLDGAVGVYVDGVAFGHPYFANIPLFDVDYVSIMAGGHSTLYGRDASAGAVHIDSNRAQVGETFYDIAGAAGGNLDNQNELRFVSNISIDNNYALRIAFRNRVRGGSFQAQGQELNDINDQLIRLSATLNPRDDIRLDILGERYRDNSRWGARVTPTSAQTSRNDIGLESTRALFDLTYGFLGEYTLDVTASHHKAKGRRTPGSIDSRRTFNADTQFSRSQLRATVSGKYDFLTWKTGFNYQRIQGSNQTQTEYDDRTIIAATDDTAFVGNYSTVGGLARNSIEYFADLDFVAHDIVNVSTGLRYIKDKSAGVAHASFITQTRYTRDDNADTDDEFAEQPSTVDDPDILAVNDGADFIGAINDDEIAYYASVDVVTNDDAIFYARYDRSVKMGGFNEALDVNGASIRVAPQINKTWEAGYKSEWFGQRLRLNTALFSTNISNYQSPQREMITRTNDAGMTTTTAGDGYIIRNIGGAQLTGVEVDTVVQIQPDLQIQFVYQYLLDNDFDNAALVNTTLPLAPKFFYLLGLHWHADIPIGRIEFGANWARTARQSIASANSGQNIPDHTIANINFQLFLLDNKLRIGLIGTNTNNTRYAPTARISTTLSNSENRGIIHYGDQYLIEIGYRF